MRLTCHVLNTWYGKKSNSKNYKLFNSRMSANGNTEKTPSNRIDAIGNLFKGH